jgi:N-acetylneuraminate synthase
MSSIRLRNGRLVGDYLPPYFIAELNTSHFGDVGIARSMVDKAKECGCDCVKFQSWSEETLYCKTHYKENPIAKRIVKKFSFGPDQLCELAQYCAQVGIDFSSTPYSNEEAEFLAKKCDVPFIKIASMELNNTPYLSYIGSLGVPLVLSTGMGNMEEIIRAVRTIEEAGNKQIAILHCVSVYPVAPSAIRLHNILGLRSEFPIYPIGYSDHSIGIEIPVAATALGACLIEKHFTLDSSKIGMDNQMASEPNSMANMIDACKRVHTSLGGTERILPDAERNQIPKMRRSLVAKKSLKSGHVLQVDDLDAKRPGTGIEPCEIHKIIGKKITTNLEADEIIPPDSVESFCNSNIEIKS